MPKDTHFLTDSCAPKWSRGAQVKLQFKTKRSTCDWKETPFEDLDLLQHQTKGLFGPTSRFQEQQIRAAHKQGCKLLKILILSIYRSGTPFGYHG